MQQFLIVLSLIACATAGIIPNQLKTLNQKEHSLTAFLKTQLLNLRNKESLLTNIAFEDIHLNSSEADLTYVLNLSSIQVQNLGNYAVSNVKADLTEGTVHFELNIEELAITGNYSLDGTVSTVIALIGQGPLNITSNSVTTVCKGDLMVDIGSGIGSIRNLHFVSIGDKVKTHFEGIVSGEIIGDLIKKDLETIGSAVFDMVILDLHSELESIISQYVNNALKDLPIDEIMQIKVLDTFMDADIVGWRLDTVDCKYSENIDFTCRDNLTVSLDNRGSDGFWAACRTQYDFGDLCTFSISKGQNETFHKLHIEGYYSSTLSMTAVEIHYLNAGIGLEYIDETGILEFNPDKPFNLMTVYPNVHSDKSDYTIVDKITLYTSQN